MQMYHVEAALFNELFNSAVKRGHRRAVIPVRAYRAAAVYIYTLHPDPLGIIGNEQLHFPEALFFKRAGEPHGDLDRSVEIRVETVQNFQNFH